MSEYCHSPFIQLLGRCSKGATMIEYALLLSLVSVVAVPAVSVVVANAESAFTEVSDGLEGSISQTSLIDSLGDGNSLAENAPTPFAKGTGWHAVDVSEKLVVPAGANGFYIIYSVHTTGSDRGNYNSYVFEQASDGSWIQYAAGVDPRFPVNGMLGGSGVKTPFYDTVASLPGSDYVMP